MKTNSTLLSNVVVFAGIATAMLMICLPVAFVQFPIWLALVLGFAIGVPLHVVGFLLHPESAISTKSNATFLPTQHELFGFGWAIIAFCAIMALMIAPIGILAVTLFLIPGDSWPIRILKFQKCDHRIRPCGVFFVIATIVKNCRRIERIL